MTSTSFVSVSPRLFSPTPPSLYNHRAAACHLHFAARYFVLIGARFRGVLRPNWDVRYLPIGGLNEFVKTSYELACGADNVVLKENRVSLMGPKRVSIARRPSTV